MEFDVPCNMPLSAHGTQEAVKARLPLAEAPRVLSELGAEIQYRRLQEAAVAGRIPAHRIGARWFIARADLPSIIAALSYPPTRVRAA